MRDKIEHAIRTTLVVTNKTSIRLAVDKIMKVLEEEKAAKRAPPCVLHDFNEE